MPDEQTTALISELQKHTAALHEYTAAVSRLATTVEMLIDVIGSEPDNEEQQTQYLDGTPIE